jgi:hypothetical protein
MMGMKARAIMDPSGDAWSVLGSSMSLPSTLSNEIEKLKLALRDVVLAHATNVATLTNEIAELRGELAGIGRTTQNNDSDDFNGFAYVSPEELGIVTEIVEPDMTDVRRVSGFIAPVPVVEDPVVEDTVVEDTVVEDPVEVVINWWDGLDEEGITFELANLVVEHITHHGPILNNRLWNDVYPKDLEITKKMKNGVKKILAEVGGVSFQQVDTFRGIYHDSNEEASDAYKRLTGKELDS